MQCKLEGVSQGLTVKVLMKEALEASDVSRPTDCVMYASALHRPNSSPPLKMVRSLTASLTQGEKAAAAKVNLRAANVNGSKTFSVSLRTTQLAPHKSTRMFSKISPRTLGDSLLGFSLCN